MQLLISRSKIFQHGGKTFKAGRSPVPVTAPRWVAETTTYQHGLRDGSIINLTDRARAQEAEAAAQENREPDPVYEEPEPAEEPEEPKNVEPAPPSGFVTGRKKK